ncbi:cyclase family protein [Rhodococcus sp. WAY2]|uniref:cyclase family protein n=1 Tax=Rhodococcus sp. WAY2 TaxID=2663121 RepID=UPI0013582255|nr:cyclase family protein [Rhodococcus sp. WAY2]
MCSPRIMNHVYGAIEGRGPQMTRRAMFGALGAAALVASTAGSVSAAPVPQVAPPEGPIVDLTHVLRAGFPVWPGSQSFEMRNLAQIGGGTGSLGSLAPGATSVFYKNELRLDEHTGTHIDAPAHASADGITVEQIPPRDLVAPIAVIDIAARAHTDNDALLTRQDIVDWESDHGTLPDRCLVAMHSGWADRVGHPGAFVNVDTAGVQRTPGFDPDAVDFLLRERDIVGLGSDTLSIDAGRSTTFGAHLGALGAGKYAVEVLANLSQIPPAGATVMVGAPTHAGGSGGPCRVLAWI